MKIMLYALAFLTGLNANAASTGTLLIQGIVAPQFDLVITPQTASTQLDITGGETNKLVATVLEKTNNPGGYKIKVTSANNGQLKNGSVDSVSYQLTYNGGSPVTPTTTATVVKTTNTPAPAGNTSNVNVSFTGKPLALSGTYNDTLTLTIEAP